MKRHLLIALLFPFYAFCQKKNNSIEIVPIIRYDNYADFDDRFADRSYTTRLKLRGISWGVDAKYKFAINNKWNAKAGIGYYKYSFNKMSNYNPVFRTRSNAREVSLVRPFYLIYNTNNYWYNCVNLSLEANRIFPIGSMYEGILGATINNFISYSQRYYVTLERSVEKTNSFQYYGFAGHVSAGLNKKFKDFYVGPHLILPIYDTWSNDIMLSQMPVAARRKWLNGVGISFVVGFYIKK
jgi:hypothetical protein